MDDEQFSLLMRKLELLTRLAAGAAIRGVDSKEQVRFLDSAGLPPREIAQIVNKTPNAIRIILFELRKKQPS